MCFVNLLFQSVLHLHPYHIDALLQLSEVFKMSEDPAMAVELLGSFVSDRLV